MSPIIIEFVDLDNGTLRPIGGALQFTPRFNKMTNEYEIYENVLGIYASAKTYEQLMDDLLDEIRFLWTAYAEASPEKLSPMARDVRKLLRGTFHFDANSGEVEE